ncbi:hypothetical protein BDR26DRAFT_924176 [Obelidium mucronatum]|nr:hypothetical protein BDR26DRAFT_924176 [Obelidium mucronatum]
MANTWQVPSYQERLVAPHVACPATGCRVVYNCATNTDKLKKHIQIAHPRITIIHRKRKTPPSEAQLRTDRKRRYNSKAEVVKAKGYVKRWLEKCVAFVKAEQEALFAEHEAELERYHVLNPPRPDRPLFDPEAQLNLRSVCFTYGRLRYAAQYDFNEEELVNLQCLDGDAWKARWKHIALLAHSDRQLPTNERLKSIPQFSPEECEIPQSVDDDGNVVATAGSPSAVILGAVEHWRALSPIERRSEFWSLSALSYIDDLKEYLDFPEPPPLPVFHAMNDEEVEREARVICDRMRRFYNGRKTPGVIRLTEQQIANMDREVEEDSDFPNQMMQMMKSNKFGLNI